MWCSSCGASIALDSRFCASCGTPRRPASRTADTRLPDSTGDETRLSERPRDAASSRGTSSHQGQPDSRAAGTDHGRFPPGALVGDRYRVTGLLGRGGMGEVFRADDLKLGQAVALKFLPVALERDPERLSQFHNEVRTARQVSHPNVCRVYDIGEIDGQHFITMEYVDGEDLSSLLRRIGRLPEDKAVEIGRQICAGLHAAHERGVLHRDLKPANIMLDRDGRARITDFSLAAAGAVDDVRAGTPAYMAPEQLSGRGVTARSDIYALGLVLYELFTGRRAQDAASVADLIALQTTGALRPPSEHVSALDPVIERAIMRCLDSDPARRPKSALAVAASLPGGDPLAAALAAGETPSPGMVAAAGSERASLSPLAGALWLAATVLLLSFAAVVGDRFLILSRVPLTRSTDVLVDRARSFEASLNLATASVDQAWGYGLASDYLRWLASTDQSPNRFGRVANGQPPALLFWYRSSPRPLASQAGSGYVSSSNPPLTLTGMVNMVFGSDGGLNEFHLIPAQVESLKPPAAVPVDWQRFFDAAGLDRARFVEAKPDWTPRAFADARVAWTGTLTSLPDVPMRVDAASHQGYPVYFQVSGPWARPARMRAASENPSTTLFAKVRNAMLVPTMFLGAALLARRNLRRGRGDRRGAARVAGLIFTIQMLSWLFQADHLSDVGPETAQFFSAASTALLQAALFWLFYLAVEPQVRRVWPHILITWSRLLTGSVRDPLVGRDLVVGTAAGLLLTAIGLLHQFMPLMLGHPELQPRVPWLDVLKGDGAIIGLLFQQLSSSIQNGMTAVLGLVAFRLLFRRTWAAFAAVTAVFAFLAAQGQFESGLLLIDYVYGAALVAVLLVVVLRYGLFAMVMAFFAHFATDKLPLTFDSSALYFSSSLTVLLLFAVIISLGFYLARAGEPLFGTVFAED